MAVDRENGVTSDTEASEKPVREKLKQASISRSSGKIGPSGMEGRETEATEEQVKSGAPNGSLKHTDTSAIAGEKEGMQASEDVAIKKPQHSRKRSRDSTAEENDQNNGSRKVSGECAKGEEIVEPLANSNGDLNTPSAAAVKRPGTPDQTAAKRNEVAVEAIASPKIKRSRLHSTTVNSDETEVDTPLSKAADIPVIKEDIPPKAFTTAESESKVSAASGFTNTSTSPFASITSPKSPFASADNKSSTSPSAFAASGFSAHASSSTSAFGAVGKATGGFGSGGTFATSKGTETTKEPASKTFGGALGQKSVFSGTSGPAGAFGSGASGFGKLGGTGGVFGSSSGFGNLGGGGLTSFASGKPSALFGSSATSKPVKSFGAPAEPEEEPDDDNEGDNEAGLKSPLSQTEDDKQDERFYAQDLETGEEDELTEYSCRAKLYNFATVSEGKKEWKERGLGVVRLNVKVASSVAEATGDGAKPRARLLMRAEGSHRVILNTPVKKELKFGAPNGSIPQGGFVYFMGAVDGRKELELLQLKVRQQFARELYDKIIDLQAAM